MTSIGRQQKPSKKQALSTRSALLWLSPFLVTLVAGLAGLFDRPPLILIVAFYLLLVVGFLRSKFGRNNGPWVRGRTLELQDGRLVQLDAGQIVASIDITQPFQYEILDRHDANDACFRLHQAGTMLTFFNSDPGGSQTVRDVLQLAWPPSVRGASFSMRPPSY